MNSIAKYIEVLRVKDAACTLYGANKHRYTPDSPATLKSVEDFEDRYSVKLPLDYRKHIMTFSNGGPGPGMGLVSLTNCTMRDLDSRQSLYSTIPSLPFPLSAEWNLEPVDPDVDEAAYRTFETNYYSEYYDRGVIRLSNYGCGIWCNLVVNGDEFGHVWFDDRTNENGIRPASFKGQSRITFADWYAAWIEESLRKLTNK